jgi:hypothetical protein
LVAAVFKNHGYLIDNKNKNYTINQAPNLLKAVLRIKDIINNRYRPN